MITPFPYSEKYEKITDIDKYFIYNDATKEMIFIGDELKVYIKQRYETYHLLEISDTVKTLAILDLVFDNKYRSGLLMPTVIEIDPDDTITMNVGDTTYVVLTLHKGSRFICRTEVIKDSGNIYSVFVEFVTRGKWLYTFDYESTAKLFDYVNELCGAKLPVDHVILEIMYSHLARSKNNISIQYRHTDMKGDFEMIPLSSVGYATTSTAARLLGSYFNDSMNATLITDVTNNSPFEDLLK